MREPPKLPIDLGSTRSTGINGVAYARLRNGLGLPQSPVRVFDVRQYLALVDDDVATWAGVDTSPVYPLRPSAGLAIDQWKKGLMPRGLECLVSADYAPVASRDGGFDLLDAQGVPRYHRPGGGLYFEDVNPRFAETKDPAAFDRLAVPAISERELDWVRGEVRRLSTSDRAIVATLPTSIFERGIKDFGYEEWLVRIMTDTSIVHAYLAYLERSYNALIDSYVQAMQRVDVVVISDDFGTQQSLLIPPQVYQQLFKPLQTRLNQRIRQNAPAVKLLLHSCGAVRPLIPDFIEAGFDALNPVQITAAGMDARELKRDYGRSIAFWGGGVDTQHTLAQAGPQAVRDEVRKQIETLAPEGGFVFSAVHNIQADVPAENIIALFETAAEYR
jgi:uroporphyrinogen decarboxylase